MSDSEIMNTPNPREHAPASPSDPPDTVYAARPGEPVSVIGETLHFKGELSADEDLVVEGTVEGTVKQGKCCLTVRPQGQLIADVTATKIFIEGRVQGDLTATVSVTVRETGVVIGNIAAPRVAITDGATFNGSIDMRDPTSDRSMQGTEV